MWLAKKKVKEKKRKTKEMTNLSNIVVTLWTKNILKSTICR